MYTIEPIYDLILFFDILPLINKSNKYSRVLIYCCYFVFNKSNMYNVLSYCCYFVFN